MFVCATNSNFPFNQITSYTLQFLFEWIGPCLEKPNLKKKHQSNSEINKKSIKSVNPDQLPKPNRKYR